jgi:hypothetical protein
MVEFTTTMMRGVAITKWQKFALQQNPPHPPKASLVIHPLLVPMLVLVHQGEW